MTLEILLVKNDSVLFRFPLDSVGDGLESLSDSEIERISALYTIGANRKRLKIMLELAKGNEMRFSEVMQIVMNPKLAQDCLQPLLKEGLVLHGASRYPGVDHRDFRLERFAEGDLLTSPHPYRGAGQMR